MMDTVCEDSQIKFPYSVTSLQSYPMVFSSVFNSCNDGCEQVDLRTHIEQLAVKKSVKKERDRERER